MTYRFGPYRLETAGRRLVAGAGDVIPLTPKAFELLWMLVRERPRAVSKEEILESVWPGVFVTENNLATVIRDLRAALGDDAAAPRYIRTVFGFGYAFAGEAAEEGTAPSFSAMSAWVLLVSGREVPLLEGDNVVGRDQPAGIVINAPSISRRHARLRVDGPRIVCDDLGSKNGTWVDGAPVSAPSALRDGAVVKVGAVALVFRSRSSGSTETLLPK